MQNQGIVKLLITCAIVLMLFMIINQVALRVVRRQFVPGLVSVTSLFDISGQIHEWAVYIIRWKNLVIENEVLRTSARAVIVTEAKFQVLQSENDILRKSLGLATRLKRQLLPAGIFNISLTPSGYHASINKGQRDAVVIGQPVVSPEGVLIGKIEAVFSLSAQVMLISDPKFSVTVKVLNGQTSGILRGALQDNLVLDLVTQADQIAENDILITTGDDLIPAGLVVGTVRSVQNNDTQLFKKVRVSPALNPNQGAVIVIQQ